MSTHRPSPHTIGAVVAATIGLALALLFAGCGNGKITGPGGGDGDGDGLDGDPSLAAQPRFARLTHAQWENTVRDLLRSEQSLGIASDFQPDPPLGRFDNNVARLSVSAGLWQDYQRAAERVGEVVATDPSVFERIAADLPADAGDAARAFAESFGTRAFRRPLEPAEIDRYAAVFGQGPEHYPEHEAAVAGVRLVVETMLQSPYFLYRTETSTAAEGDAIQLSAYEVASRLSYAFWNTMPDDDLFTSAAAGELDSEEGVRAHAERLFDDPRTRAQFESFHFQAFDLAEYLDVDKDPALFPEWSPELAESMQREMSLFLGQVVFDGGTVGDFLTSRTAFVDGELAAIYGVAGDFGAELQEVELDPTQRAGFLTRAGFLARNSTLTEPDPIHRGVFANLNILCRDINAVPNLPDNLMPVGDTNRERIESINGVGTCGENCHATTINPLGFALENYDAVGRWRDLDNGFPVDAADTYRFEDGREITFQNGMDLSQQLADAPEVHACYARQMLEYIYGRDIGEDDLPLAEQLAEESLAEGLAVRDLIVRVVASRAFRYRPVAE